MAETETVEGVVTSLTKSGDGFKLDDKDWINYSKKNFTGSKPNKGDRVSAECEPWQGKLYAKRVTTLSSGNGAGLGGGTSTSESIEKSVCLKAAIDMAVANLAAATSAGKGVEDWTPWTLEPQHIVNVAAQLLEFFAPEPVSESEPVQEAP